MRKNKARMALKTYYGFDYHLKLCRYIRDEIDSGKNLSEVNFIQNNYKKLVGLAFISCC